MPLTRLYGIGDKAEEKLSELSVKTIGDLQKLGKDTFAELFGPKRGEFLYNACRGVDDRPVAPRVREQYGNLASFKRDTRDWSEVSEMIKELTEKVIEKLGRSKRSFKTVTVTFITEGFETHTKSRTLEEPTGSEEVLKRAAEELTKKFLDENSTLLRRLGVGVTNLSKPTGQKTLAEY